MRISDLLHDLYWFEIILLVLLCTGDTVTTQVAVMKGAIEINPLAAHLLRSQWAFVGAKMGAMVLFVCVFERARRRSLRYLSFQVGAMGLLSLLYLAAIGINLLS